MTPEELAFAYFEIFFAVSLVGMMAANGVIFLLGCSIKAGFAIDALWLVSVIALFWRLCLA